MQIPTLTPDYQLGMSDLLPPSPSAANYSSRAFAPSLSTLSSSVPSTEASAVRNIAEPARPSTTSLRLPPGNSPPLSHPSYSYSKNTSSFNSGAPNGSFRPAIRPLDFGALM